MMNRNKDWMEHPCFCCSLPDCDDRSSKCLLRKCISRYSVAQRRGKVTETDKRGYAQAYLELYSDKQLAAKGRVRDVVAEVCP